MKMIGKSIKEKKKNLGWRLFVSGRAFTLSASTLKSGSKVEKGETYLLARFYPQLLVRCRSIYAFSFAQLTRSRFWPQLLVRFYSIYLFVQRKLACSHSTCSFDQILEPKVKA